MGAIYGIAGEADPDELWKLGERLRHRGGEPRAWSLSRTIHLGILGTAATLERLADGVIVFDGAIDNRREVACFLHRRPELAVVPEDDALLVLELFASFGVEALGQLAGRFAFALWDGPNRQLVLGRDRIGYAPLYFALDRGRLAFASEYKALLALDELPAQTNPDAIQTIHATGWTKPGVTCLAGIFPVAPGSVLAIQPTRLWSTRYWQLPIRVAHRDANRHADGLRDAFAETLRRQIDGYDRVGVSLGGGLDSAVVAAAVRHLAPDTELHTFSGGYGLDDRELVNASIAAEALGAHHHPVVLEPEDLAELLPSLVWYLEEPIGCRDTAYLLATAREAANYVDIMLTGFGFDELFGGLPRHRVADLAMHLRPLRGALGECYDYDVRSVEPTSRSGRTLKAAYFRGAFPAPAVRGAEALPPFGGFPTGEEPLNHVLLDGFTPHTDQAPVERLYTGCGVRMNAHHTDPSFLAAAFAIPDRLKIHWWTQKYILRKAYAGLLPRGVRRLGTSAGHGRHELRMSQALDEMADELLAPSAVAARKLFDPSYVAALRKRSPSKPYSPARADRLWALLLTETWSRIFLDGRGTAPDAVARAAGQPEAPAAFVTNGVAATAALLR